MTGNEIVKEPIFQTTLKRIVRSFEKQEPCTCIPYTPYVETEGFMRAMACYSPNNVSLNKLSSDSYNVSISDES